MELGIVLPLLVVAAVGGDQLNFTASAASSDPRCVVEHSRFFSKHAAGARGSTSDGGITIMLARCRSSAPSLPFISRRWPR